LLTGELPRLALMHNSLLAGLVDGHSFAGESSSAYVKTDESAARVCPFC
jgi:hypothetical protein